MDNQTIPCYHLAAIQAEGIVAIFKSMAQKSLGEGIKNPLSYLPSQFVFRLEENVSRLTNSLGRRKLTNSLGRRKLTNSLGRRKLTNSLGKQLLELWTRGKFVCIPYSKGIYNRTYQINKAESLNILWLQAFNLAPKMGRDRCRQVGK